MLIKKIKVLCFLLLLLQTSSSVLHGMDGRPQFWNEWFKEFVEGVNAEDHGRQMHRDHLERSLQWAEEDGKSAEAERIKRELEKLDRIDDACIDLSKKAGDCFLEGWRANALREANREQAILKGVAAKDKEGEWGLKKMQYLTSKKTLKKLGIALGGTGLSLMGSFYLFKFLYHWAESALGRPSLIRESSRHGLNSSFKKFWVESILGKVPEKESLNDVIMAPGMSDKLQGLAKDARNTQENGLPYRHVLFYGLPGTGKTMFAKRLAKYSGMDYAIMSGADFAQFHNGEGITELHKLFDWAENSKKGLLIFIDEADSFLRDRRVLTNNSERNLLNAFLSRTGTSSDKYMLVFASNYEDELDPAVLSRINKKINFPLPALRERFKILKLYLKKYIENDFRISRGKKGNTGLGIVVAKDINDEYVNSIAQRLEGFSGREIDQLVSELRICAYNKGNGLLSKNIMEDVVKEKIEEHVHDVKCADFQRERNQRVSQT